MLKKLFIKLHTARFFHYTAVGSSSFVLDMISLFLLTEYLGLTPVFSVMVNQLFILSYVFLMNKYWSFKSTGQTRKQLTRFVLLTGFNYIFSITWMWLWTEMFHFSYWLGSRDIGYLIGRVISIMIMVLWNFLLYKYWIYRTLSPNH